MEHHRLKPMPVGYDEVLFNDLFQKTAPLRRKLAFEIDYRKFGVDYKEIVSWFDVKFLHAFIKYEGTKPKLLMGYLINSLQTYKYRIMRSSYQLKYHTHAHMLDVDNLYGHPEISSSQDLDPHEKEMQMNYLMKFMSDNLSDDALFILQMELNPPPFILVQMKDEGKKENVRIPISFILDYLGLEDNNTNTTWVKSLRSEIRSVTNKAKEHFMNNPIPEVPEFVN